MRPSSDAVIDARGFVLACADADLEQEKVEFAQVAQRENQATPAERAAWRNLRGAFEKFRMLHIKIFAQDCGAGMDAAQTAEQAEAQANYQFSLMAEGFREREISRYNVAAGSRR